MSDIKIEFTVQFYDKKCAEKVRQVLAGLCSDIEINENEGRIIVKSKEPWSVLQHKIESTGRKAVLSGFGQQSAVAIINATDSNEILAHPVQGVVRISTDTTKKSGVVIDGIIDGLTPGQHGIHVHETGDISKGCASVGEHFNPHGALHGAPENDFKQRHAGDLGNICADKNGRASFRFNDSILNVSDIIGRAIVVTSHEDDFGHDTMDGNSGNRIACGIIARSAGIFENYKKICACDGVTLWDERKQPLAGGERGQKL